MNQEQTNFWEQQKNGRWKTLTNPLINDPETHAKINSLITTFYWKFRENKGIAKDAYSEVNFLGFKEFKDFPEENKMGHCEFDAHQETNTTYTNGQETGKAVELYIKLNISISQKYLLDRLGMDKIFYSEDSYITVNFNDLIGTIAHELAHAYQQTVNNFEWGKVRSQCESSGDKKMFPKLVAEHTVLTNEIKGLIESSAEYQEFKKWWTTGEQKTPLLTNNFQDKKKKLDDSAENDNAKPKCQECQKAIPQGTKNKYCEECEKTKQYETKEASAALSPTKGYEPIWIIGGIISVLVAIVGFICWLGKKKGNK